MICRYFLPALVLTFACCINACTDSGSSPSIPSDTVQLYKQAGFPVGVAVNASRITSGGPYSSVALRHFNSFTAENAMKPAALHPEKDIFNWRDADSIAALCSRSSVRLHGHTLVWHNQIPYWMESYEGTSEQWEQMLKNHIQTIAAHFRGKAASWDVLNEAFEDDGTYRNTIWRQHLGDDYIAKCFQWAREADPDAKLFYNDYGLENNGAKLQSVLAMLDDFRTRGIPIDGIGFQMHIADIYPPMGSIRTAVQAVQQRNMLIHFSELDVSVNYNGTASVLTDDMKQRQKQRIFDIVSFYRSLPAAQQFGITMWGVSDADSWIPGYFGRPDWPLLFDASYQPKPAFYGFADAVHP